jgi:hypothetical protein
MMIEVGQMKKQKAQILAPKEAKSKDLPNRQNPSI